MAVDFPDEVAAEAERVAAAPPIGGGRRDLTALEFVTLDPPGSLDLDQAMLLERQADGYVVRYAIADVAAVVAPGSALEQEAWRRGVTVYCPDTRALLYPAQISEGAASLLPDQTRAAIVFSIELDAAGEVRSHAVERALVRSRAKLAYGGQEIPHLEQVGKLRRALADRRGAVHLRTPAQEVVPDASRPGGYRLELEPRQPDEDWNAEISLLAGAVAASIMLARGLGVLRTMPPPDGYRVERLRRSAAALGVAWPKDESLSAYVNGLDPAVPHQAALLQEAHSVFGRAGYTFFEGKPPSPLEHAAVASPYAHATAPLRRLQDRYVLDLLAGGGDPDALRRLPEAMNEASGRAAAVERAVVDLMETRELEHRIGEVFGAVALDHSARGTTIWIDDPPVRARLHAEPAPPLGEPLEVRLVRADPASRSLQFARA